MRLTALVLLAMVGLTACGSLTAEENSYKAAVEFQEQGKLTEAIAEYGKVLELNPQSVEAYANRGGARADMGEYQMALQDYDQALQLNPEDAKLYLTRANLHSDLGESGKAIEDYSQAIRITPTFSDYYHRRANVYALSLIHI